MSTTPLIGRIEVLPHAAPAPRSQTLVMHYRALAWTLGAIFVCLLLNGFEKFVAIPAGWLPRDSAYRMFRNPSEIAMRLFGFAHFVVGILFLVTSRRVRAPGSAWKLAALLAAAVAVAWLFRAVGADANPIAALVFYFYFLVHGFRDEVFFYRSYGEMPVAAAATHTRVMVVLQALLLGLMLALLLPLTVLYGELRANYRHPALEAIFPASWPYTLRFFSTLAPMLLVAAIAMRRIARQFPNGMAGLWQLHRPILLVFLTQVAIIILPLWSGGWTFQLIILLHFVSWYLFARHKLRLAPAPAPAQPPGLWGWMRSTPRGFAALHLGIAAVTVVLVAVNCYAFGKSGPLNLVVGREVFYYWTIFHVTLSFFPR